MRSSSAPVLWAGWWVAVAVGSGLVHAQPPGQPGGLDNVVDGAEDPATNPILAEAEATAGEQIKPSEWKFKAKKALEAVKAFEQAEDKRKQTHEKQGQANIAQLIASLEAIQREVTQAGDLDDAILIRDALADLKNGAAKVVATSAKTGPKKRAKIPARAIAFKGHHYFFVSTPCSWRVACQKCEEVGGHLVILDSKEEYAFVARLRGNTEAYVGATRDTSTGGWEWIDGRPCQDIPWGGGQPNNGPSEMYLGFYKEPLGLHDYSLNDKLPFVCEWDE
ncbi:MAG: C-type lectin domain-containing protein [Planctomycetia bacterium]